MSINGKAYIAGVYEHPLRVIPDKSSSQIQAECAFGAVRRGLEVIVVGRRQPLGGQGQDRRHEARRPTRNTSACSSACIGTTQHRLPRVHAPGAGEAGFR